MHHFKYKCSNKQGYLKIPCCTIVCGRKLQSTFKRLPLIQTDNCNGQTFQGQCHNTEVKQRSRMPKLRYPDVQPYM